MRRILLSLTLLAALAIPSIAQDSLKVYLQTDLTSVYLWRGQRNTGMALQPVAGLKWRGLDFYAWGNVQLSPPSGEPVKYEIDLFLKYAITKHLTMGLKNVYVNTRGDGAFSFGSIPHAANGLDVFASYDFKYVNAEWSTTIAGYDGYNHSGKRAYGSYLTINAPFSAAWFDWTATVGIVPYYCSRYSDDHSHGFHVNMCSLKMAHTFSFPRANISLTPYATFMVNPSARTAYFQIAARFLFAP